MDIINEPAFYFPLTNGRYEVIAGLHRLEHDFGNGRVDQQIFQFDKTFPEYYGNKLACRAERLSKYYQTRNLSTELCNVTSAYLISQLCTEHPDKFKKTEQDNCVELLCKLTGETLYFDADYVFIKTSNTASKVPYASSLDAVACQIQEDIAIVQIDQKSETLCALHLCSPNHWAAEEKIGQSFLDTHRAVPHMEKINPHSNNLFKAVLGKGSYVRFAWGLSTNKQLNQHPQPPTGSDVSRWRGRHFNPANPALWLRVERQTLTGLKQTNAILFTIRTYFYDVSRMTERETTLSQICSAIRSMSAESLAYKGLQQSKHDILNWLDSTRKS